jgi:hypothetical protein
MKADVSGGANEMQRAIVAVRESIKASAMPMPDFPDTEIWGNLVLFPEFSRLIALSIGNWKSGLDNIEIVAPDRQSRIILLHSFANLAPADYLKSSSQVLDLMLSGKISKDEFLYIVLVSPNQKRWFWSYNYDNPDVIQFLNRVRGAFTVNKNITSLVGFILSGEAKTRDDHLRKESPFYRNQPLPLLSGAALVSPVEPSVEPSKPELPPLASSPVVNIQQPAPVAVTGNSVSWWAIGSGFVFVLSAGVWLLRFTKRSRK